MNEDGFNRGVIFHRKFNSQTSIIKQHSLEVIWNTILKSSQTKKLGLALKSFGNISFLERKKSDYFASDTIATLLVSLTLD